MKELSLNILDIVQNSVQAEAENIEIEIVEDGKYLTVTITDDGYGMKREFLESVLDPFTTTRTTRDVGLGLPLLKMAAEQTEGSLSIESVHRDDDPVNHGTRVKAVFVSEHIDCPPLGDIVETVVLLVQGAPFKPRYMYRHVKNGKQSVLDTNELHEELGGDIPLSEPEVLAFISDYLGQQEAALEE